MLKYLKVSQFAIIENVEVSFEEGLNVLTGETGAGKSLLIDAIGLLLGERASSEIIRTDADYALVTAIFEPLNQKVKETLKAMDIPFEDDELLISRKIKRSSGNLIKANRETITLSDLRKLTNHLADIHTQHDTKRLFDAQSYLELIDAYNPEISNYKEAYKMALNDYKAHYKKYESLKKDKDSMLEKLDLLKFQSEELHNLDLKEDELSTIEERLNTLQNFDSIFHALKESYALLETSNATANIYEASKELSQIETYDETYASLKSRTESTYYELDDIRESLSTLLESLDFDPDELETLENRKHTLDTLRRKYNKDIDELIEYHQKINQEIQSFDNYDETLDQRLHEVKTAFKDALKAGKALREMRVKTAFSIQKALKQELEALALKSVQFKIEFNDAYPKTYNDLSDFYENGIDEVEFMLSTNKGESLKPLKKIASGGELSRIMLALKTLLVKKEGLNLMIFDEIDTGVSGYVASQVAKKMQQISKNLQVLAITHLPQVAAKADHHYYIYKEQSDARVKTNVKHLNYDNRVDALAQMISSDQVTEASKQSAKELLK